MPLSTGAQLGPYEVLSPAGSGGMGEVYRARDTRLGRDVAIKVLPPHLASSPDLRARLDREAKAISSLQHPHICTLFDVGHQSGVDFLVMEFLEGETLAERLKKGPLPTDQLLRIAIEIADALDKAHRNGIVHRDLKPGNVMLTRAGAKLMDFGLAKPAGLGVAAPSGSSLPAFTAAMTQSSPVSPITVAGTVVGTFQYMSPEQIEGREADTRSDIFAFGALLYEMATGRRAFEGKSQLSVASAILEKDPEPISALQPTTPPALENLIARALAKNPDDRWQSAHDIKAQLEWISVSGSKAGTPAPLVRHRKVRERGAWLLAALGLLAAAALAFLYLRATTASPPVLRALLSDSGSSRLIPTGDNAGPLALSPDGKYIVYLAIGESNRPMLFLRSTSSLASAPIAGTQDAKFPFWSYDSRSIGYFQNSKLRTADIAGNPPVTVADAPDSRGGSWCDDNTILYTPDTRIGVHRVNANGGTPQVLTKIDMPRNTTHRWPQCLPGSSSFLYYSADHNNLRNESSGIYQAAIDGSGSRLVVRTLTAGQYVNGQLLYLRENALLAAPFDPSGGQLKGEPQPIAQGVLFDLTTWRGVFSASDTGLLAYQVGGGALGSKLMWLDRQGKTISTIAGPEQFSDARLSPDGKKLVASIGDAAADIWVLDLERATRSRLTFGNGPNAAAIWSPDGKRVAFISAREGRMNIYVKAADGTGTEQPLMPAGSSDRIVSDWTSDGRYILYFEGASTGDMDVVAIPLDGDRKPFKVVATPSFDTDPFVSPDGRWIAYSSNDGGRSELYVSRFPTGAGKWQISSNGGAFPRWSRDGRELFYVGPDRSIMRVAVSSSGEVFHAGVAETLFRSNAVSSPGYSFDPSPDGKRFFINTLDDQAAFPMVLVVNWQADLKK